MTIQESLKDLHERFKAVPEMPVGKTDDYFRTLLVY